MENAPIIVAVVCAVAFIFYMLGLQAGRRAAHRAWEKWVKEVGQRNTVLSELDWVRLREMTPRALDPEHQWAFDAIRGKATASGQAQGGYPW